MSYTAGRYVVSWVGAAGARDPIALTSQVKVMRDGFVRSGHTPALMLVVVDDDELDAAVELVQQALDAGVDSTVPVDEAPAP